VVVATASLGSVVGLATIDLTALAAAAADGAATVDFDTAAARGAAMSIPVGGESATA
jgi:hypothetical protein